MLGGVKVNIKVYTKTENFVAKLKERGLTCYALSKLIACDESTMYKIKNGRVSVKINTIKEYCEILECEFDDIFYIKAKTN